LVKTSEHTLSERICDGSSIANCNAEATLDYVSGIQFYHETYSIHQQGINVDGPLFDLPGGVVRAALGAEYRDENLRLDTRDTGPDSLLAPHQSATSARSVWAVFSQINVPIFSDLNAVPLFRRLELQASWRHDHYSDVGGTSNPKIAMDWALHDWIILKGSWGKNFRAPDFAFTNGLGNYSETVFNNPGAIGNNPGAPIPFPCGADPASLAGKLEAGGVACGGVLPPGLSQAGTAAPALDYGWRTYVNQEAARLRPETATTWAFGFEFAPSSSFLQGLDIQATWFSNKINGQLSGIGAEVSAV
jgi:iron complex outermembrane receptor protein